MQRLYGSDGLFPDSVMEAYHAYQSVNFVTAHDGFTLYDLVSYNHKHNAANGHGNADGTDHNYSWNCGWEGDTAMESPHDIVDAGQEAALQSLTYRVKARSVVVLLSQ